MIIVRYKGGLGNQMFQYAFQIAVMEQYPQEIVKADISHYELLKEHNGFELDKAFGIRLEYASPEEVRRGSPYYVPSGSLYRLPECVRKTVANNLQFKIKDFKMKHCPACMKGYYKEKYHNSYEEQVFVLSGEQDWYLDGLWQNIGFMEHCKEKVRQAFTFRNESRYTQEDKEVIEQCNQDNTVSVHVRRGDFVNSKFDICGIKYYRQAMDIIERNMENPHYIFFTDDISFVEKEFSFVKDKRIISHSIENSIVDMEMMGICRNNIISNSTFSFWGAYLSKKINKIVVAPKYSIMKPEGDFLLSVPEDWIRVDIS